MTIVKRDNSKCFDIRGVPVYKCTECGKRHQNAKIAETHMRRKHGTINSSN